MIFIVHNDHKYKYTLSIVMKKLCHTGLPGCGCPDDENLF